MNILHSIQACTSIISEQLIKVFIHMVSNFRNYSICQWETDGASKERSPGELTFVHVEQSFFVVVNNETRCSPAQRWKIIHDARLSGTLNGTARQCVIWDDSRLSDTRLRPRIHLSWQHIDPITSADMTANQLQGITNNIRIKANHSSQGVRRHWLR